VNFAHSSSGLTQETQGLHESVERSQEPEEAATVMHSFFEGQNGDSGVSEN
jgi:hypothetical protein